MTPIALLLKSLASGELPEVEFPPYPSAPQLVNWKLLYDRQAPRAISTKIELPTATYWRDYLYPLDVIAITADRPVNWVSWSQSAAKLSVYGGLSDAVIGASTIVPFYATNSHGVGTASIRVTIVDGTLYNNRPILTAGLAVPVSNSPTPPNASVTGDEVVQVTANKTVTDWQIVSGNPTVDGVKGFTINSSGFITVDNPALFVNDPYIINSSYELTVRATDTYGIYGFVDVPVSVSDIRVQYASARYCRFRATDTSYYQTFGAYHWNQSEISLYASIDGSGKRVIPVNAVASSMFSDAYAGTAAFDGNNETLWATAWYQTVPQFVTADLGSPMLIRSIRFSIDINRAYPRSFAVDLSNDGVTFFTVKIVTLSETEVLLPKIIRIQ